MAGVIVSLLVFQAGRGATDFEYRTLRFWGYVAPPKNPVGAWMADKLSRRRQRGLQKQVLLPGPSELHWSYSSRTSGWYQFGFYLGRTNHSCWSFALPRSTDVQAAVAQLPQLQFYGPDSNVWVSVLGNRNASCHTNVMGLGAIRLQVGQCLFVRHNIFSNAIYLVQCYDIGSSLGETKARFRYKVMDGKDHTLD